MPQDDVSVLHILTDDQTNYLCLVGTFLVCLYDRHVQLLSGYGPDSNSQMEPGPDNVTRVNEGYKKCGFFGAM